MAGTNGGRRPGAGRKPKIEKHISAINKAEKQIKDRLPDIIDALMDLALGTKAFKVLEGGGVVAYTTLPDRAAGQYLADRIMGKPVQKEELSGPDGADLVIKIVYDEQRNSTDTTETV